MLFQAALLVAAGAVASVNAHATFQQMWVNGVDQGAYCVRLPQSNSPVTSVSTADLACNAGASPSIGLCSFKPGDSVTVEMHQQNGDRSCSSQAIGGNHYGPMIIYMAAVPNALTAVGSAQSWFKIAEMGLPSSNPDYWGTEVLNDNCGHYTFVIPTIAPGQYLLRAEVIALHAAGSVGGAQFYMSCYTINVGGTGSGVPAGVSFPGAYKATDPGIEIDIYVQLNSYVIPGPTPYATTSPTVATTAWPTTATWNTALQPSTVPTTLPPGGAAPPPTTSAAPTTTVGTTSKPSTPTSGTTSSSKPPVTTTTSASGATQTKYGQCGGAGWTGPTVCAAGSTCTASGSYYSQCL